MTSFSFPIEDSNCGESPVVLLLHGLGSDSSSWYYQVPVLTQAGFHPVALDLPGFGKSPFNEKKWTIPWVAQSLATWLSAIHARPVIVVGISLGGTIALQFALDFPLLVERLVLVNTFACLRPKHASELVYLVKRLAIANIKGIEYQAGLVAERLFPNEDQDGLRRIVQEQILSSDHEVYRQAMLALGTFDVRRRLKEINLPTLVISAEQDTTVPLDNQADLVKGIKGAKQVIIPNSRHAVIVDQPELFNQVLIQFLKQP